MIIYLLKSIACLLILLIIHRLIFQREAIYRFNRFYLLAAVLGSFFIPLVEIEVSEKAIESTEVFTQEIVQVQDFQDEAFPESIHNSTPVEVFAEKPVDWNLIFWSFYCLITLVFLIRFIRNINLLIDKINRNVHVQFRGETLVLLHEHSLPFSFLSYIFVSKDYFNSGQLTDSIFAHEQAHVKGRHSWDNLLIEGLLVIFWFHPGLYLARQAIKLNHEFIADAAALQITPLDQYKNFLLAMMLPEQSPGLASNLNFSLTKKRFEMMKRHTANSTKWIKILLVLPVLGALVYFFSEKVTAQAEGNSEKISINMESKDNGSSKTRFSTANQSLESKVPTATNYQKLATEFQLKITKSDIFTQPSNEEIEELRTQFLALDQNYFNLSMEERRKVSRVSFPYAKIEKDGKILYKKFELLTEEERKTLGC